MTRKIVLFLGFFVALNPYLGFSESIDTVLYTILGLLIAFLAWSGKKPQTGNSIDHLESELLEMEQESPLDQLGKNEEKNDSSHGGINSPTNSGATYGSDKMVSVSFEKKRSRSLKRRIMSETPPEMM